MNKYAQYFDNGKWVKINNETFDIVHIRDYAFTVTPFATEDYEQRIKYEHWKRTSI